MRIGMVVSADNRLMMQTCGLYSSHKSAILEDHHICPKSWFDNAGVPVETPMRKLCPTCHENVHAAIDGILLRRNIDVLPPRVIRLADTAFALAKIHNLVPSLTL